MTDATVRRVRLAEWRDVRELRLRAVSDPAAPVAFLSSRDEELARDDAFWQARTAAAALGEDAAQFVAVDGRQWVGTVSVLLRNAGATDHLGRTVDGFRADVVGVYIEESARGRGLLARLIAAAAAWARDRGADALTLDVHIENAHAQAAYRRVGFTPTGETSTSSIGSELVMRMPLS